jgi:hypothetical protein
MSVRGIAAALLLLVVGLVGGYAAAYALDPEPATSGAPAPIAAADPSVPVDPLPTITAQPAVPALGTDLPMSEGRLGNGGFQLVHPVPAGWSRISSSTNEVKWKKPGNPAETYVLRVGRLVSREETLPEMVEDRIDDLREEKARFAIEQRTANSLEFTYVSDGFLRHGFLVWLDVRASGFADVEIAVNGRGIDAPGAEQLITRVAGGMRQV